MKIGVPTEIKSDEYRVGLVPSSIRELCLHGHEIFVQSGSGLGIDISDEDFKEAGATILQTADEIFDTADMIVKVKEPQQAEIRKLKPHHVLFTYLHLAPDPQQTAGLIESGCTAIAYETVTDRFGHLPLLAPMSVVAGRMSVQAGAHALEKPQGGRGVLLGGVPGVKPANVVVIGGGVVGTHAVRMAIGMEAAVTVLDKSLPRLEQLDSQFGASLDTIFATKDSIERYVKKADLVIGAVLVPGASAPKLVSRALLREMQPSAVVVDVAIDQGGCFETSRPTTHSNPMYVDEGIVHYCVANMPGAAPRTASFALNNATLPFVMALANKGYKQACLNDPHLLNGLNVYQGKITHLAVAEALNYDFTPPETLLVS